MIGYIHVPRFSRDVEEHLFCKFCLIRIARHVTNEASKKSCALMLKVVYCLQYRRRQRAVLTLRKMTELAKCMRLALNFSLYSTGVFSLTDFQYSDCHVVFIRRKRQRGRGRGKRKHCSIIYL